MLNLSDKELDRLAREAANEYDPGNPAGSGSWDRLQLRLDNELGNFRPNFFRSIRRMPFYYAPAILLVVGVSYYLMRSSRAQPRTTPPATPTMAKTENSGSPPASGAPVAISRSVSANDRSITNQNDNYRSNSTHDKEPLKATPLTTPGNNVHAHARSTRPGQTAAFAQPAASGQTSASGQLQSYDQLSSAGQNLTHQTAARGTNGSTASRHGNNHRHNDNLPVTVAAATNGSDIASGTTAGSTKTASANPGVFSANSSASSTSSGASAADLTFSIVRAPQPIRRPQPVIDDSGLRMLGAGAGTAAATAVPVNPARKSSSSMHIDRPLSFGFSLAPDFASVNSLAGDKPGSTIGVTVAYQFFNRWHIQTGFLLAHKNYTAAEDDYHVPYDYYRMNNMHDVSFVKGTLNLYEIPLDLRYDFSIAGNTTFFVSGGLSSYLLTHENCNYYFDLFGRAAYQEFKYDAHRGNLFATVDLSMGVETGLSNSFSLLIAPYMKLPTTGLGFGKIEMNSVGIEFGVKYTPVLRRKRH